MKETDIRPADLIGRYRELCTEDTKRMKFSDFVTINCPGCSSAAKYKKFNKNNFTYDQCKACGTLYCNPRPTIEMLSEFYEKGESSKYWTTVFFPAVVEARREKLFKPKAEAIAKRVLGNNGKKGANLKICDAGPGHGTFLEELQRVMPAATFHAIEANPESAVVCRQKGFETQEAFVENSQEWAGRFDLVISSELVEHVFSPERFIRSMYALAKPGGTVLITGLGNDGFDILTLGKDSKSVHPPHHINFLSVKGYESLFKRAGFNNIEVWTPGELDADIVLNHPAVNAQLKEFLKMLSVRPRGIEDFQEFLRNHKLSSHVWAQGVRPN